ncbi:MAG: hypothetical protein JXQ90_13300 [Cyclobacteriaceae bacterium]
MRAVCLMFLSVLCFACGGQDGCREVPETDFTQTSISLERLESELFSLKSRDEVASYLNRNKGMSIGLLHANEYPSIDVLAGRLYKLISDSSISELVKESIDAFDEGKFIAEYSECLNRFKGYVPNASIPKVQTAVTGLYNDLYITDSLIVVGLDFFIGPKGKYMPKDIPEYILRRYTHDHLVPTLGNFIIGGYSRNGKENTLLSEMIDYGKIYYTLSMTLPCVNDELIIGFKPDEMVDVKQHQEIIWASLLENEVLYETEEFMKTKFLGERPNVYEIGDNCPGRIGAWVGWEIVRSYMEKWPDTSIAELLEMDNHHELFAKSGYKPKNN